METEFDRQKLSCLSAVDLSRKGSVDTPVVDLVQFINAQKNYFTTSSCSGRIIVVDSDDDGSVKKKGCRWIFTSHEEVDKLAVAVCLKDIETNAVFKFEPFILHVQCRTLLDAQLLLGCGVASGFRNSGISVGNKGKFVVAIRSTHSLEIPLSCNGKLLVNSEYIAYIVDIANKKMAENLERINQFFITFQDALMKQNASGDSKNPQKNYESKSRKKKVALLSKKENISCERYSKMSEKGDCYDFSHKERGFAVVIVNNNFPKDSGMNKRRGWKKDLTRMKTLFQKLEFRVKCYKNLKGNEIVQKINKACSSEKNKDADCFACVISSHGNEEPEKCLHKKTGDMVNVYQHCVYGSDGIPVYVNDILDVARNDISPHLAGKPKLFFIQACRSRHDQSKPMYDYGVAIQGKKSTTSSNDFEDNYDEKRNQTGGGDREKVDLTISYPASKISVWDSQSEDEWNSDDADSDSETDCSDTELPARDQEDPRASPDTHEPPPVPVDMVPINCLQDCLIMYPVASGKVAFTNPVKGSYLLSYMYSKLDSLLQTRLFLPYLTEVVREVAKYDYNPEYKPDKMTVEEFYNCPLKTAACIVHRLTGDIVFVPKKEKTVIQKIKNFYS